MPGARCHCPTEKRRNGQGPVLADYSCTQQPKVMTAVDSTDAARRQYRHVVPSERKSPPDRCFCFPRGCVFLKTMRFGAVKPTVGENSGKRFLTVSRRAAGCLEHSDAASAELLCGRQKSSCTRLPQSRQGGSTPCRYSPLHHCSDQCDPPTAMQLTMTLVDGGAVCSGRNSVPSVLPLPSCCLVSSVEEQQQKLEQKQTQRCQLPSNPLDEIHSSRPAACGR